MESDLVWTGLIGSKLFLNMSKSKLQDLKIRITELKTTPEEPSNSF
jgi:hypothetical protein